MQLPFCFRRIGIALGNIARAARRNTIRDRFAAGFFKRMDDFQNRIAVSGTQIINLYARSLPRLLQRFDMTARQIDHMDIVPYARSVRCGIVVSKNADLF